MSALFSVSLLLNCPEVSAVVLVDGSVEPSKTFETFCATHSVEYVHTGKAMSFAEAYNAGVARLNTDWIALMASDVYVLPGTFAAFKQFIEDNPDLSVGCLIPYLSQSDFRPQEGLPNRDRTNALVPVMTINLNVFRRGVYIEMGGLSEKYSGNYNDVDMAVRLRDKGLSIYLVDAYAHHYGSLTLRYGTNTRLEQDKETFFSQRPDLLSPHGWWALRFDQLFESRRLKWMYRAAAAVPSDTVRSHALPWVLDRVARYQRLR